MIEFTFETTTDQKTLPELVERRRLNNGRIVVYQRVASFIFLARHSQHYSLVGPYESRSLHGLLFFLPSLLIGWWSPTGFFYTNYALAHNLLGGTDVTDQLIDPEFVASVALEKSFKRKRFVLFAVLSAVSSVGALGVLIMALPSLALK